MAGTSISRVYISVVIALMTTGLLCAQSPHGTGLQLRCDACHSAESWKITPGSITSFDHDSTRFALLGRHATVDCRQCHTSLEFEKAPLDCASCHTDMHQGSVGFDCARCHDSNSWLVNNITEIHEEVSFPLLGAHATVNCFQCHISDTDLRFDRIGTECINCHRDDYDATSTPEHKSAGFSTECQECHTIMAFEWAATGIDHNFFPLTKGHEINDCARCHTTPDFSMTSPECYSCHRPDYEASAEPKHTAADLPTDCASCHTTDPGWEPAEFIAHDGLYFPIYSGKHKGTWDECRTCHEDNNNYAVFSCTVCHEKGETDEEHDDVTGYAYSNSACLACHPNGLADGSFDHNATSFPLTGVHLTVDCNACHFAGYAGTPTECVACHDKDYQQTSNPSHTSLGLSTDCASCHTTDPEWNPAAFPVHNDFYVLAGAHAGIANDCAKCHNGDYNNTPNTCVGCHLADYNATNDPNHVAAQFSTDCATCHNENAWQPATIDHDAQYFPIYSGSHNGQWSQCVDCHTNPNNYAEFTCITCHANPETDEEHNAVSGYAYNSPACLACHPTGEGDGFDHNMTDFPLTGAHLTVDCSSCHAAGYAGTPTECVACHTTDYNETTNPNHPSIGLNTDCASCHTTLPGWEPAAFPVHNDYYALEGAHAVIATECVTCHNGDYNNTPNTCVGCHQTDYDQTMDPDHAESLFPTDCAICHGQTAWVPSAFDHALTDFPLTGAHTTTDCASCHASGYTGTPTACASCHTPDYEQTQNPNHSGIGLSNDCAMCHTTNPEWNPATFPVHNDYYVLSGAHAMIATECVLCHNGDYNNTPNTCVGCHQSDYDQTTSPSHMSAQFSTDCATCHNETAWEPSTFDHDGQYFPIYSGAHNGEWSQCLDCHINPGNFAEFTCITCHANPETDEEHNGVSGYMYNSPACLACHPTGEGEGIDHNMTAFPLTGAHLTVDCISCHSTGFEGTPTDCAACHTMDFEQTTNPNHGGIGLSMDCASCHTTAPGWNPAQFPVHNEFYVFEGAHVPISNECAMCHNGDYNNTPNTCVGCHQSNYNEAVDPNHVASQFPTECAVCHNQSAWEPATIDHSITAFPLNGAHVTVDCASCHAGGYTGTPTDCAACHIQQYNATTDPDHAAAQFPTDCALCHTEAGWSPASIDHDLTDFPLTGAHVTVDCASCHASGYTGTPTDCAACHITHYNSTSNPSHTSLGLSTDCAVCHTTNPEWNPATFPVHNNYYALNGAHAAIANDCALCHNGDYNNTPNTCIGCHLADFNGTTDPDHEAEQFPTDCLLCHSETAWSPSSFDHNATDFPLTGAHIPVNCASCHSTGYSGTPTDCAACHQTNYNQTTNPSHTSLGLSTDCATCHTTNPEWNPATFPVHNNYYVLAGAHAAIANECALCHNGDYNNTPNTCIGCHLAEYNGTTDPDHEAEGYPTDCTICHGQNAWSPATFDHNQTDFPLTGAHIPVNCASCHASGYTGTPTDCAACHLSNYNQSSNPSHTSLGLSTDCATCHTTAPDWNPATFPVHNNYYVLQGAHAAIANECVTCHNGNYNNTPNTCVGCHLSDYNATNDPDHESAMFPTDCASCHTQNAWEPATFDHDNMYFPIYSGKHDDEWNQCSDCHTNPNNYSIFTCITCHTPAATNAEHGGVSGYQYESNACYACHPEGED